MYAYLDGNRNGTSVHTLDVGSSSLVNFTKFTTTYKAVPKFY